MIETVARFVTRAGGKNPEKVDLLIGKTFSGETSLKKNTIYELRNIMGELVFVEVGPSAIGDTNKDSALSINWGLGASSVIQEDMSILTKEEYNEVANREFVDDW